MAFGVRVLHSLLLGLAGFSLVLCTFFYATPVALRYGESAAVISVVQESTSTNAATAGQPLSVSSDQIEDGGNHILRETGGIGNNPDGVQKQGIQEGAAVAVANVQETDSKVTTAKEVKEVASSGGSTAGATSGVGSSLKPGEDLMQPVVSSSSTSAVAGSVAQVNKVLKVESLSPVKAAGPNDVNVRQSVIQHISPKVGSATSTNTKSTGTLVDTTMGIVTSTMYEAGHDISNPDFCSDFGSSLKVLILVTSAPNHSEARNGIRQTWGHYNQREDVAIAFFVGGISDPALQNEIYTESKLYGDLIQSHFKDSYNNLTLKTISMLEWVDIYCHKVNFILKTDDDMFINVPKLLDFIGRHTNDKRMIFGRLAKKWKPMRNKKSKYYVSKEQYKNVLFPDFTTGPAYLLTGDIVHELYTSALNQTYLKLEDVYTTGIVAQELKVKRVHVNEFLNKKIVGHACNVQKAISIHMVKFHEQFDLWKKLLDGKTKCK